MFTAPWISINLYCISLFFPVYPLYLLLLFPSSFLISNFFCFSSLCFPFFFTLFSFFLCFLLFSFTVHPFIFFPLLTILSFPCHYFSSLPISLLFSCIPFPPFFLFHFLVLHFLPLLFFFFFPPPPPPHCSYLLSVLYPEFSLLYQVVTLSKSSPEYGDICGGSDVGNSSLTGLIYSGSLGSVVGCVSMGWIGTKTGAKAIKQDTL